LLKAYFAIRRGNRQIFEQYLVSIEKDEEQITSLVATEVIPMRGKKEVKRS
jgi:hypothetical protein